MNLLAHAYLSGNDNQLMVGNFIADAVKGKAMFSYSDGILKGIILHRAIDNYTDKHPLVKRSIKRLNNRYGKYGGVVIDVLYDHFLAQNWVDFSNRPLTVFADDLYSVLVQNVGILPTKVQLFLPVMIRNNWLVNYNNVIGIRSVFAGLSKRSKHASALANAYMELEIQYDDLACDFVEFFPQLISFCKEIRENTNTQPL